MTKILIVDEPPVMRGGLAQPLSEEMDLDVTEEAGTADKAMQLLEEAEVDLAIVDISLEGSISGIELIKHMQERWPEVKVLVVSRHDESLYAERAIRAGARGYVLQAGDDIVKAVRQVMNGRIYVSDEITDRLLMSMATGGSEDVMASPLKLLSDRELEVFELTGRGLNTREIAERLHLSPKTVESYRARTKSKLRLDSATELTRHAVRWVEGEGAS
jgi:DNA-binding NarL/FixJ family response regulator